MRAVNAPAWAALALGLLCASASAKHSTVQPAPLGRLPIFAWCWQRASQRGSMLIHSW